MANSNPSPSTSFRPGNPGSPGRPPGCKRLTELVARIGDQTELAGEKLPHGLTVFEAVVVAWFRKAIEGDARARRELLDRLEGKVADRVITAESRADPPRVRVVEVRLPAVGHDPGDGPRPTEALIHGHPPERGNSASVG